MDNKTEQAIEAARELVSRLRQIAEDPHYMAVWTFWANHGMKYNGPFYVDELAKLEKALQNVSNDSTAGSDND